MIHGRIASSYTTREKLSLTAWIPHMANVSKYRWWTRAKGDSRLVIWYGEWRRRVNRNGCLFCSKHLSWRFHISQIGTYRSLVNWWKITIFSFSWTGDWGREKSNKISWLCLEHLNIIELLSRIPWEMPGTRSLYTYFRFATTFILFGTWKPLKCIRFTNPVDKLISSDDHSGFAYRFSVRRRNWTKSVRSEIRGASEKQSVNTEITIRNCSNSISIYFHWHL